MTFELSIKNDVVDFIDAFHTAFMEFPGRSQIVDAVISSTGTTPRADEIDELLDDENFNRSLEERGIIPPWNSNRNVSGLTREQLAVVASLNNPKDRRSDSKKLADLGISSRKFMGWMHDKHFTAYMKKSANNLLDNMEAEAHMGLLRSLNSNNTAAQKLYFEMTGRYNPAHETNVNIQTLMTRFIEIIQKHVHDKESLLAIAADLQLAAIETGAIPKSKLKSASVLDAPVEKKAITSVDPKFDVPIGRLNF